jgi:outer membrane protein assembly factor BamB
MGRRRRAQWLNRADRPFPKQRAQPRIEVENADRQAVPIEIESGAAMLTAPLVVEGVRTPQGTKSMVLTLAASNTVAALDPATGKTIWQRTFENTVQPASAATWVCTNTSTATPVIDKSKGLVYLLSADGRLHGLSLGTGEEELQQIDFVPPFSRTGA